MKQKTVIQVAMSWESCRSKAMKIASLSKGRVDSVAVEGGDRNRVVVIGEDVDPACLAKKLRKKFGHATIVGVEEVKAKKEEKKTIEEVPAAAAVCCYYAPPPPTNPCPSYLICEQCPHEPICTII